MRHLTSALPGGIPIYGSERLTTTVSTKGQVVLPKAVRATLRWGAGTRLVVENTPDGVLLIARGGAPKSLAEMEAGVLAEAKRRHAGASHTRKWSSWPVIPAKAGIQGLS